MPPTLSPAVRRLWTASLIVVLALIGAGVTPALSQSIVAVVTDPDGVNLRGGPGTQFESLAVIPLGTALSVLGPKVNEDWVPVAYQGRMGFVFDEFIELRPPTTTPAVTAAAQPAPVASASPLPSPSAAASPSQQQVRTTSPDGLNLRAGPGTDQQRVLAVIPFGTRLTVIGRSADMRWVNVSFNGQVGWVDAQYVTTVDERTESNVPSNSRFIWPVAGRSITTYFSPSHPGVDIDQFPAGGNPVMAVAAGRVSFVGGNACCSYGLLIKIEHPDGSLSLYAHLQSMDVREGQEVTQGQTIGRSGNTGFSTGAHLHFEIHVNGSPVDPLGLMPR